MTTAPMIGWLPAKHRRIIQIDDCLSMLSAASPLCNFL
jgi:hypothetical protein